MTPAHETVRLVSDAEPGVDLGDLLRWRDQVADLAEAVGEIVRSGPPEHLDLGADATDYLCDVKSELEGVQDDLSDLLDDLRVQRRNIFDLAAARRHADVSDRKAA